MLDEPRYPDLDPNKKSAKDLWNERFQGDSFLFGKEPSPFLKQYCDLLMPGEALDVGTGEGRNAVYLAQKGFKVSGIDCSDVGIEKGKKLASEKGAELELKTQNLDFFLMPLMKLNTITMNFFKPQPRFFSELRRGLVERGTLLIEGYTVEHYKRNQDQPNNIVDFEQCYKPNELLKLLKDFQVLYYNELPDGESHFVQAIAIKSGK